MSKLMITHTQVLLERVSNDPNLFCKELLKAIKNLLASELEELARWFVSFTKGRPELQNCKMELIES
jgi:hypothetical protein